MFENAVCRVEQLLGKLAANSPRILLKLKRSRFSEIRTIDATVMHRPTDAQAHAGGRSVNDPFTMQHIVHHATHCSPFRQNAAPLGRESRASARQNLAVPSALAFA
jgi:hypothetical protein